MKPHIRKPLGVLALLLGLFIYAIAAVQMLGYIDGWHGAIKLPLYVIAGLLWLIPMKRVLMWIELGRWR